VGSGVAIGSAVTETEGAGVGAGVGVGVAAGVLVHAASTSSRLAPTARREKEARMDPP
jgi:hypothetical protein